MYAESALQRDIVEYLTILENQGKLKFFATMSENKRSPKRAGIAKAMGLRAGVPDLIIYKAPKAIGPGIKSPPERGRVINVELKTAAGKLSPPQKAFREFLNAYGFGHHVVRSLDELLAVLA